jgi:hypothetical protein
LPAVLPEASPAPSLPLPVLQDQAMAAEEAVAAEVVAKEAAAGK